MLSTFSVQGLPALDGLCWYGTIIVIAVDSAVHNMFYTFLLPLVIGNHKYNDVFIMYNELMN